jgi:hypothetical protein
VSGGRDFYVVDSRSRKVEKVFSVQRDIIGSPEGPMTDERGTSHDV